MNSKRLVAYKKGAVCLEDFEINPPKKGEVLLEAIYSTVSPGTELAWINHMVNTPGEYPYYPGYSTCGKVLEVGEGVVNLKVGDIVVYRWMHTSHITLSADICTKVFEGTSLKDASAYRLASISLQGIRKAQIQVGDQVAVIGLGPIGNLAAQLAKVAGAGTVVGIDMVAWRRELALKCNVDEVYESADQDCLKEQFDVVIEATGAPAAINLGLKMSKKFGKLILLGSTRGVVTDVNFYLDVHRKGVTIIGAHECRRANVDDLGNIKTSMTDERTIMLLLGQKRIRTDLLINETTDVKNAQIVYDRLLKKEEPLMLVTFQWKID